MTFTTSSEALTIHDGARAYTITPKRATYDAIKVNSLTLARLVVMAMRAGYRRV